MQRTRGSRKRWCSPGWHAPLVGGVFEREEYPALLVDDRVDIRREMTARGVLLGRKVLGLVCERGASPVKLGGSLMGLMENQMHALFCSGFPITRFGTREQNQVGLNVNHRKSGIVEVKKGLFSRKFAGLCPAQAKDDQLQLTVLSCSANNRSCCRTIMDINFGFTWLLSKCSRNIFKGVTPNAAADKRRRLPHARGCCGRRALTSRNAQHSTRAPLICKYGILTIQRYVLPGVNGREREVSMPST